MHVIGPDFRLRRLENMAKLTRSGLPRRKPGPKPKTLPSLHAAVTDPLAICLQAYDSAPDPKSAAEAFRRSMPAMEHVSTAQWAGIVAQGMARRALSGREATTMLYAAQVAAKR
jgi:hypothetical protein